MSTERKNLELTVGLFLFIGFAIIATLVVVFGRVGQGFQKMYTITVEFPNAGGLIKGSDVLLSGVRIGMTKKAPAFTGQNYQAEVELSIKESAKIPRQSVFEIHTNGMLGDSFIDVTPPAHFTPADFAADGERIVGKRAGGFEELTTKGSKMIDTLNDRVLLKVSDELDEIKVATKNINAQLLTARNMKNLEDTLANLKKASNEFSEASQKLNVVAAKVGDTVDSAKTTLKTVDSTVSDLKPAISDVRKLAASATKTVDSARVLITKATTGDGPLGTLVSDRQTAENLRSLIANLKRSGILFYKDRPVPPAENKGSDSQKKKP